MSQHILDMGLLEEPQSAPHGVRNSSADKLALKYDAVVMIAIQDRHLAQGNLLGTRFENLLADEIGLLVHVGGGRYDRSQAVAAGRDQLLGKA